MKKWLDSFHPFATVTILMWALAYVLTRLALQHYSALSLGFLRYAVASVILLALVFVTRMPLPKMKDIPLFIGSGVTGFGLYTVVFNIGASHVTAATSSVILASVPVITALLASLVFKEKLVLRQWIAIGVEFAGILVLTLYGAVFSANIGVPLLFLAAVLLSVYNLLQRKLTRSYSGLQATTYSIFCGTIMLSIFSPAAIGEVKSAPPIQLVYILIMGVFCSAVAYIAWSKAFEKAPRTSQVSNYMFFTPFLTVLLGFLLADELPDASTWLGGAVILAGALMFNLAGSKKEGP